MTNCPLNIRPNSTAACCIFKWRNHWTPVCYTLLIILYKFLNIRNYLCVCARASITMVNETLLQCSVNCGMGTRSRQRVCMRLYPRNGDEKQPRRKGQPVDPAYCEYLKQLPFVPKTKVCRKQCIQHAKWVITPWSRVSMKKKWRFLLSIPINVFIVFFFVYCAVFGWLRPRLRVQGS